MYKLISKPASRHDHRVWETALQLTRRAKIVDDDKVAAAKRRPAHRQAGVRNHVDAKHVFAGGRRRGQGFAHKIAGCHLLHKSCQRNYLDCRARPLCWYHGWLRRIPPGHHANSTDLQSLNPDMIKSIEVVKGSAATTRYTDPRAANGVIVVTMKPKN